MSHRPSPTPFHYLQIALTAAFFTCVTWPWFSWKGGVSFFPFWIFFEIFYRSRARVALSCPHCGFDPYIYLVDAQRARAEIEAYWRKKFAEKGVPFPDPKSVTTSPPKKGSLPEDPKMQPELEPQLTERPSGQVDA